MFAILWMLLYRRSAVKWNGTMWWASFGSWGEDEWLRTVTLIIVSRFLGFYKLASMNIQ